MVATNITWHQGAFARDERQKELGQKVWTVPHRLLQMNSEKNVRRLQLRSRS